MIATPNNSQQPTPASTTRYSDTGVLSVGGHVRTPCIISKKMNSEGQISRFDAWLKAVCIRAERMFPSFYMFAAWYTSVVPFLTALISYLVFSLARPGREIAGNIYGWDVLILLTSLIFGIVSLFGIRRHGWKILVMAAVGILASLFFGVHAYGGALMCTIIC